MESTGDSVSARLRWEALFNRGLGADQMSNYYVSITMAVIVTVGCAGVTILERQQRLKGKRPKDVKPPRNDAQIESMPRQKEPAINKEPPIVQTGNRGCH
jgi:hypothetical protein